MSIAPLSRFRRAHGAQYGKYIHDTIAAGRRFGCHSGGSVSAIFAVMLILVLLVAGVGIDFGRIESARVSVQSSLDAAVLAGAAVADDTQTERAKRYFSANLDNDGSLIVAPKFSVSASGQVSGEVDVAVSTTLVGIMGVRTVTFKVTSTAGTDEVSKPLCALVLGDTVNALNVTPGVVVDAPDCEVHVRSKANPSAIIDRGSKLSVSRICLGGHNAIDHGGEHPALETDCKTAENPLAGKIREPYSGACNFVSQGYYSGTYNLTPGVYCGWHHFSGPAVNFAPGVYVIKGGGWSVSSSVWRGKDVVFYFADTSFIQFNTNIDVDLSAPRTGDYAGLIMAEKDGLTKTWTSFHDSISFNLQGTMYLPSRGMIWTAGSKMLNRRLTLIVDTLTLDGPMNWQLQSAGFAVANGRSPPRLLR